MIRDLLRMICEIGFGDWKPSCGYTDEDIKALEVKLGLTLPEPLKDFYITLGRRHEFMESDYHIYDIVDLVIKDDCLVFCEENQGLAEWGVKLCNIHLPNPQISGKDYNTPVWVNESLQASAYLINLACWQAIMSQDEVAQCSLKESDLHEIENHLEYIGDPDIRTGDDGRSFMDKTNRLLASYRYVPELLYVGTSQENAIECLEEESGLVFDWL